MTPTSFLKETCLSLTPSKLRICSANHRTGYFSNLACDWMSIVWANSEQEIENRPWFWHTSTHHYDDVIMGALASQITSLTIVYSTVYSHTDQRKHQSSASLAFVWGIHRGPVNSSHQWPVTRISIPFDDVLMYLVGSLFGARCKMLCIFDEHDKIWYDQDFIILVMRLILNTVFSRCIILNVCL